MKLGKVLGFLLHVTLGLVYQGLIMAVALFGNAQAWLFELADSIFKQKVSDGEFCLSFSVYSGAILAASAFTHASWEYTLGALLILPGSGALLWATLALGLLAVRDVKKLHAQEERLSVSRLPVPYEKPSIWLPALNIVLSGVAICGLLYGATVGSGFVFHKWNDAVTSGFNQLIEWRLNNYDGEDDSVVSFKPSRTFTFVKNVVDMAEDQMTAFRLQWPFVKHMLTSGNHEGGKDNTAKKQLTGKVAVERTDQDASANENAECEELAPHEVRGVKLLKLIHSGMHLGWHMTPAYGMPLPY